MIPKLPPKPKEPISIPYKFKPREYQLSLLEAMDSGYKRAVAVYHRRAGKDKTLFNLLIKKAFERVGIYYYFFPEFAQGRRVIWDGIDKDGFKFLNHIPKKLIRHAHKTDMKIELINGSIIQIIGTDNYDKVRGSNPVGCVFSEYAYQNPAAWNVVRPILGENGGWAVFNSCVIADTLVLGKEGFERIGREYNPGYSEIDEDFYGLDNSFHKAEQYYVAGERETLRIKTKSGYKIECTPEHMLWTGSEWKRADKWLISDTIPIQRNQQVFNTNILSFPNLDHIRNSVNKEKTILDGFSIDILYEAGLILGDGYVNYSNNYIIITTEDEETVEFLLKRGYKKDFDNLHYRKCSKSFVEVLRYLGFTKKLAKNKTIPEKVLRLTKELQSQFLAGYFDADGHADKRGRIVIQSASIKLIEDLHVLLLNYGITATYSTGITRPTKKIKVESEFHRLEIHGYSAKLYYDQIGFRLTRKQKRKNTISKKASEYWNDRVSVNKDLLFEECKKSKDYYIRYQNNSFISYNKLKSLNTNKFNLVLEDNFYYDEILSISASFNEVFDFVIPETHSFFSNGFISHNTPLGKNHFYDMYNMAVGNEKWYAQLITVEDSVDESGKRYVGEEVIEEDRQSGMTEEWIQQEYYCSFTANANGFYYVDYLNDLEEREMIGVLPHETNVPVDTWWDIGVGDSTAIWFTQIVGKEIHIIDYYEGKNVGLDVYAKALQAMPYVYGSHNFPHDMANTEFGTGKTRLEMAYDLFPNTRLDIVQKIGLEDGINAARIVMPRCRFDAEKCEQGLKALYNYHREWDDKMQEFKNKPKHDWSSHPSDAFRYFAVGLTMPKHKSYKDNLMKNRRVRSKNWMVA